MAIKRSINISREAYFAGSQPYHGYLICSTLTGRVFFEKEGFLIAWAQNVKDAMRQIEELTA